MMKINRCDACGFVTTDMTIIICPNMWCGTPKYCANPWQYQYKFGVTQHD